MNPLKIDRVETTIPQVSFDPYQGVLEIQGMSRPEKAVVFYQKLIDWVDEYAKNPQTTTIFNFKYKYFNTHSAKCIVMILDQAASMAKQGHNVEINWYYEEFDEDMRESGETFSDIVGHPFNFHTMKTTGFREF